MGTVTEAAAAADPGRSLPVGDPGVEVPQALPGEGAGAGVKKLLEESAILDIVMSPQVQIKNGHALWGFLSRALTHSLHMYSFHFYLTPKTSS